MKRFITYLFLGAFLLHSASRMIVYFNYWLNQEFIAQNLCENREKPQMECNGKCHLKKELNKDDERKEKDNKQQVEINLLLFQDHHTVISFEESAFIEDQTHCTFVILQKTTGFQSPVFHPPTHVA